MATVTPDRADVDEAAAPTGVTVTASGAGEAIELEPVSLLEDAGFGTRFLLLGTLAGSICAPMWLGMWAAGNLPPALGLVAGLAGLLGAMGPAPVTALSFIGWLTTRRRQVLVLTPLGCRLGRQQVPWGDVASIEALDGAIRFHLDGGARVDFRLRRQPPVRVSFVRDHLSRRLEQLAPGDPEDVPAALRALQRAPEAPR